MLSPNDIDKKAERLWPKVLSSEFADEPLFPYAVALAPPGSGELGERYEEVRQWNISLENYANKHGLVLEKKTVNHRGLGTQHLPRRLVFPDRESLLGKIGKRQDYLDFAANLKLTRQEIPQLESWLEKRYRKLARRQIEWRGLLSVVQYFLSNPLPNKYLRELDISTVDSKFVEQHRAVLSELLDHCLSPDHRLCSYTGSDLSAFCQRFGLKFDQPQIRWRWLDPQLAKQTLNVTDIAMPLDHFAALNPQVDKVFITENKINGLSFPDVADGMVIFGLGYGIDMLAKIDWLCHKHIYYWGDIDTHGFHILDRLRRFCPHTQSLLMDDKTLQASKGLWGEEEAEKRFTGHLNNLTDTESQLYQRLLDNFHKPAFRLEQERISFHVVESALEALNLSVQGSPVS